MKTQRQSIRRQGGVAIEVFERADSMAALFLIIGVLSVLFSGGCDRSSPSETGNQEKSTQLAAPRTFYEGYEEDLKAMRETVSGEGPSGAFVVSTVEAAMAAERIFKNIDFVGMMKEEVLALLGDPATISDHGVPAKPGPDEPLVYSFGDGWSASTWALNFEAEEVVSVEGVPTH